MIQLKYYPPAGRGGRGGGGVGGVTKKRFVWESSGLTLFFYILFFFGPCKYCTLPLLYNSAAVLQTAQEFWELKWNKTIPQFERKSHRKILGSFSSDDDDDAVVPSVNGCCHF